MPARMDGQTELAGLLAQPKGRALLLGRGFVHPPRQRQLRQTLMAKLAATTVRERRERVSGVLLKWHPSPARPHHEPKHKPGVFVTGGDGPVLTRTYVAGSS